MSDYCDKCGDRINWKGNNYSCTKPEWKPKQGEMIKVSDIPNFNDSFEREFVGMMGGDNLGFVCASRGHNGVLVSWKYAKPIPKKKHIPFTFETFPKGMVWIYENSKRRNLILDVHPSGVKISNNGFDWDCLLNKKMSLDGGESWQVAGVEVEDA